MEIQLAQISGAIAGGLIGGLSGFVANNFQRYLQTRRLRRNVACALLGEIEALRCKIRDDYLGRLEIEIAALQTERRFASNHFRGEKDYAIVFRSLGQHIGLLSAPLPRDLVAWYIGLAVCQERAREFHDSTMRLDPDQIDHAIDLLQLQHSGFSELVNKAAPLLEQLARL
ncbi:hypothetical protein [Undibacterium terreum]|uniref:Uncharacterized protein n=1 Tax=Undibacterium terreum TaxID=1224302 RepID=A0A916USM3_9BURK|nr:hypothetical protein [Undibacterium terreum]GGC85882.1 hypothetical protein GCM10011396_36520 [Undibacterium terreum]